MGDLYTWTASVQGSSGARLDYLTPGTQYTLVMRIAERDSSSVCNPCMSEMLNTGTQPLLRFDTAALPPVQKQLESSQFQRVNLSLSQSECVASSDSLGCPLVIAGSGIARFAVTSPFATARISDFGLSDASFVLSTGWVPNVMAAMGKTADTDTTFTTSTASVLASSFVMGAVPGLSSIRVGVLNDATTAANSKLLISNNLFAKWSAVSLSVTFDDVDRCSSGGSFIKSGAAFADSILLNTRNGVIGASANVSNTSLMWKELVPQCITQLVFPQQPVSAVANEFQCVQALALGSGSAGGRAWLIDGFGTLGSVEILDVSGKSFSQSGKSGASGAAFVSGALPGLNCSLVTLLTLTDSTYRLVSVVKSRQSEWNVMFEFPAMMPTGTSKYTLINSGATLSGQSLTLSGMTYHQTEGNDLFIWGNALLYSPDGGKTVFLATLFSTSSVTLLHFTSSADGAFSFVTSDYTQYYGQLGGNTITALTASRSSVGSGTAYFPFFDHSNVLRELTVSISGSNTLSTRANLLDTTSVLEFSEFSAGNSCPYSRLVFLASQDNLTVRINETVSQANETLPESIYLDYKQTYSFAVILKASSKWTTDRVRLGFSLSNSDAVSLKSVRSIIGGGRDVRYDVTIQDLGVQGRGFPGRNLKGTVLRITPIGANYACKHLVGRSWKTLVSHSLKILSGCAPYQAITFEWDENKIAAYSHTSADAKARASNETTASGGHGSAKTIKISTDVTQGCPNPDPRFPCLLYEDGYTMHFFVQDRLFLTSAEYHGKYEVEITHAGPTLYSMRKLTMGEKQVFNPIENTEKSGALIWSHSEEGQIIWLCQPKSPCYGIVPSGNSTTPDYFFTIHMTTLPDNHSYCILETEFTVRLYGLPASFGATAAVTFGFMILVLGGVAAVSAWEWARVQGKRFVVVQWLGFGGKRSGKVYPADGSGETLIDEENGGGDVGSDADMKKNKKTGSEETLHAAAAAVEKSQKVHLHAYHGPEKRNQSVHSKSGRRHKSEGGGGVLGFLRRRKPRIYNEHDEGVVTTGNAPKQEAPVQKAMKEFKIMGHGGENVPTPKRGQSEFAANAARADSIVAGSLREQKREQLLEDHYRGSIELVDALQGIHKRKENDAQDS
ncbi:hypothetical protein HDU77_008862 [Chytriomyces hyalinus]|nr:hypothetical protein HDU77_008862 [Chytriomyces hyalinus]